ncbi:hypothetical protein [Marseilla massiliensis]|uniref:hypothetical protein n=1 Tax=Marseilla massiliensis TaxID=1841864 RepID=UPI0020120094|nr:hypothetical protein [Marseilla massiliensis]MCL1609475.1 hypothetical protein [Marseilla massiliensis]
MENEIYILIYFFSFLCGINSEEKPISSEGMRISSEEIAITSEEMPFSSEEIRMIFCPFSGQKHPIFTLFFSFFGRKAYFFGRNKYNFGRNTILFGRNRHKWGRNSVFLPMKKAMPEQTDTAADYDTVNEKETV